MTQTFFLRNLTPTSPPTAGEKSTALPTGTNNTGSFSDKALRSAKGSASYSTGTYPVSVTTAAVATRQVTCMERYTSVGLTAGTYGSGSWVFAYIPGQANGNVNFFICLSIYFWRPSTSSVVGYVYDSTTQLGSSEADSDPLSSSAASRVITVTGSNVTITDGDVLVCEVWHSATQSKAVSYSAWYWYDGSTDITTDDLASGSTSNASRLTAPADIAEYTAPDAVPKSKVRALQAVSRAAHW